MIHYELMRDQSILIITLDGPLQKADFEQLAKQVDPVIASNGSLAGLMICTKSFPGWDSFGALVAHLKFIAEEFDMEIIRMPYLKQLISLSQSER